MKVCVFTGIFSKDAPFECPGVFPRIQGWDYVMLTNSDPASFPASSWDIRQVPLPDEVRALNRRYIYANRYYKWHPQQVLSEYDVVIYTDGMYAVNASCEAEWRRLADLVHSGAYSIIQQKHQHRACAYAESDAIVDCRKDTRPRMDAVKAHMSASHYPPRSGLYWNAVYVLNNRCELIKQAWAELWEDMKRMSYRDQPLYAFHVWKHGLKDRIHLATLEPMLSTQVHTDVHHHYLAPDGRELNPDGELPPAPAPGPETAPSAAEVNHVVRGTGKTVAIVGYGYVGKAMYEFFSQKHRTIYYDPYVDGSCTQDEVNRADLAVVCVFTPAGDDGACDVSIVDSVIAWIQSPVILIKSTVAPGTTDAMKKKYGKRIVFSPEYIGESEYGTGKHNFNKSALNHSFVTLGGDARDTEHVADLIMPIFGPNKTYMFTDAVTAELAKYMENCFFATKLVFCYEFAQICKAFGANYHAVRECWLLDPRMESSHSAVFSYNAEPFSGKCLPKDLKAICAASRAAGYEALFLQSVDSNNARIGKQRRASWSH